MKGPIRQGLFCGTIVSIFIILTQPFHPAQGLIPELRDFLTGVPIWIMALLLNNPTPLIQGIGLTVYFATVGVVLSVAFNYRAMWGWFLLAAMSIHHYFTDENVGRPMGEVVQWTLNMFGS